MIPGSPIIHYGNHYAVLRLRLLSFRSTINWANSPSYRYLMVFTSRLAARLSLLRYSLALRSPGSPGSSATHCIAALTRSGYRNPSLDILGYGCKPQWTRTTPSVRLACYQSCIIRMSGRHGNCSISCDVAPFPLSPIPEPLLSRSSQSSPWFRPGALAGPKN